MVNKSARITISILSIVIGLLLIWNSIATIWDYLAHPNMLRMFGIPMSRLIIKGIFGILLISAGILLLKQIGFHKTIYNLIAFCLLFYGLDILIFGSDISGYGLFHVDWLRLSFLFYWITGYIIYFINNRKLRITNRLKLLFLTIGFLLVSMIDIIYFFLNPNWIK